jgi:hypothetical protein
MVSFSLMFRCLLSFYVYGALYNGLKIRLEDNCMREEMWQGKRFGVVK